ncbi:Myb DNA-bind 3 domain-containing protein [Abeliophyllum distichum]|uniref:Myb DNA-bind 3 domain-containing protein n=1 Tax=Abeliophyllum distichum TaxID=126358 RepID=A0ABD1PCA6_9LAMI
MIANGFRHGKCFTKPGWDNLTKLFNSNTGNQWTRTQLKNHWFSMRREYQQFNELLRCTGIEYDHSRDVIFADDWWWERKIQENKDYAKFKGKNCAEIMHKYRSIFRDTYDSKKYALSPSKFSKKGFDDDVVSLGKIPFRAELHDEHVPSSGLFSTSAMECSGGHSGEKRKHDSRAAKGKKKVDSRVALSESVEKLASAGDALASHLKSRSGPPSFEQCMQQLNDLGVFDGDENYECWAISFFREGKNRVAFAGCRTDHMKIKWMRFEYTNWLCNNPHSFD